LLVSDPCLDKDIQANTLVLIVDSFLSKYILLADLHYRGNNIADQESVKVGGGIANADRPLLMLNATFTLLWLCPMATTSEETGYLCPRRCWNFHLWELDLGFERGDESNSLVLMEISEYLKGPGFCTYVWTRIFCKAIEDL